MNIITPILIDEIYHLNLVNDEDNIDLTDKIISILKTKNVNKLTYFIKNNHSLKIIALLLKHISYNLLIDWYRECFFLKNYWSKDLLNYVINNTNNRYICKYFNNEDYYTELMSLNNQYGIYYNFTDNYIKKKISDLKLKLSNINLDNLIFGENFVKLISNKNIGKNIHSIKLQIHCYSIDKEFIFEQRNKFFTTDNYYVIMFDNLELLVSKFKYNDFNQILINNMEEAVYFNNNIYCKPSFYQKLDCEDYNLKIINYHIKNEFFFKNFKLDNYILKYNYDHKCYQCKKYYCYNISLENYKSFCYNCGKFNYINKNLKANLIGTTFFVTGIRVKIGFATALKLLRMGSVIIGTTRYPNLAINNYQKEKDYLDWKNRLIIIKCNFLNLNDVNELTNNLLKFKINGIINCACQTVRQSQYYKNIVLNLEHGLNTARLTFNMNIPSIIPFNYNKDILYYECNYDQNIISQINNLETNIFKDYSDIEHDISWNKKLEDTEPNEIVEVTLINQLVPTLLINKLKAKLLNPKFIIQVTALEGQFNTKKVDKHVHTNMCKAAMNMLIRTLSEEDDSHLNVFSVNPGYIGGFYNNNNPGPLSIEDGASRIIYPIIKLYNGDPLDKKKYIHMKNYLPSEW